MVATRKLEIQITGEDRGASHLFGTVGDQADRTESKMSGWAKGIAGAIGAAFAVDTILDWGSTLISAAEDAQKVTRQTEAVIASMGGASKVTADEVAELAEAISLKTGLDDEMIQSGENVLLTFGNIRNEVGRGNDVFTRATQVATDMSVAMGQDLQTSVVQVGKALNDPIAGIGALSRVGVQFSQDQQAMIESLVATGDTLGAQKIILQELERQFGGSAEAQATASDKLRVAWDSVVEKIGTALLPAFESIATWLADELPPKIDAAIGWIRDHKEGINDVVGAVRQWVSWCSDIIGWLGRLIDKVKSMLGFLESLRKKIEDLPVVGDLFGGAKPGPAGRHLVKPGTGFYPALAEGGIVTRPTMALIGEGGPEAVVPLGRGRMGGTVENHFHFHGAVLDGRRLIDEINEALSMGLRLQAQGRGL